MPAIYLLAFIGALMAEQVGFGNDGLFTGVRPHHSTTHALKVVPSKYEGGGHCDNWVNAPPCK